MRRNTDNPRTIPETTRKICRPAARRYGLLRRTIAGMVLLFCLSVMPAFPAQAAAGNLVFLGDSRTVEMYNAVYHALNGGYLAVTDRQGDVWQAKSGEGLTWLMKEGFPEAEKDLAPGMELVILMGINDVQDTELIDDYASYINTRAALLLQKDIRITFVSLNPVLEPNRWGITNAMVDYWNEELKKQLHPGIRFLDVNAEIEDGVLFRDWGHYGNATYQEIYCLLKGWDYTEADALTRMIADGTKAQEEKVQDSQYVISRAADPLPQRE